MDDPGRRAGAPPQTERRLVIEWRPGRQVTARLEGPAAARRPAVLLAHGAGAGQGHPFIAGLRRRLAAGGYPTMTFDYPYVAEGRRVPDRLQVLLECHRAASRCLAGEAGAGVVLAGKSMGSRVAGHLAAAGEPCRGVVCFGYPLVPPGGTVPRDTTHLEAVAAPILFLSGSRDRLGPLGLLLPLAARLPAARLEVVEGADHSFGVRATANAGGEAALDLLAALTLAWLGDVLGRRGR